MSNLSALVDAFLHPEIPYFDTEHLIVGGVTGLVSSIFLGLLMFYTRRLANNSNVQPRPESEANYFLPTLIQTMK